VTGVPAGVVAPNPVLPGTYPDPSVCRVGEWFYLVTSTFEYLPGLPVHRSRDLVSWEPVGHVVHRPEQLGPGGLDYGGIGSSGGLYAPTIRHHAGLFWVVCTLVHRDGGGRGGHVLLTAADAAGPWSAPTWLDGDGIDPSLLFDDDGRVWFHATRPAGEPAWPGQTEVWLRELDPAARRLVGPEHVLWTGALHGAVWAEGPHLYRVDGAYYLVAAEGGTEHQPAVAVARADAVTGPYTGHAGNPVLTHRHLGRASDVVGVGHADLVQAPDGSWWAVVLGMRPYGGYHYPLGRETFLVPVVWEEGWPVLAPGLGRVPDQVHVPFAGAWRPGVTQGTTSGVVAPGDPRWTAVRALPAAVATARGDGWALPLRPVTLADVTVPAFLGLRLQHRDVDLRTTVAADLADGEEVGLALRQSEEHHVRVAVTGGATGRRAAVRHRAGSAEHVLGEVPLPGDPGAPVTLLARVRGTDVELLAGSEGCEPALVGRADLRTLDSVATGGFLGVWLGLHGSSAGRPSSTVARFGPVAYQPV
jgi:alpha-N-arabinofuranosidase